MDISKEYIKMCEMAEELQENRVIDHGSLCVINSEHHVNLLEYIGDLSYYGDDFKYSIKIQVFRQDQLQEMYGDFNQCAHKIWEYEECWTLYTHLIDCNSMEQLWLGFIMNEKYNKYWKDEKWIEIN